MKKFVTAFLFAVMMAVSVPFFAETASAQTTRYRTNRAAVTYKKPNVYRRHRKAFNIGVVTGLGMLVGGLVGGRKGVVIGGLAGAGGGALVTHKQRPKNYYRRVYRRY